MSKLADRFTQLDKRARVLLAAGTALALIVVAGGSVLTLHPTLSGRSDRALPGTTIWVDGVTYHQVSPAALWGTGSTNCLGGSGALHTQLVTCITTQVDDNTLWYLEDMGNGYSRFRIRTSGFCLDAEGDNPGKGSTVIAYWCRDSDNDNQLWQTPASVDQGDVFQLESKKRDSALRPATPKQLDRSSCWMIAQASAGGCPSSRNLHGAEVKDGSSLPAGS
jgi:hypothetical protein